MHMSGFKVLDSIGGVSDMSGKFRVPCSGKCVGGGHPWVAELGKIWVAGRGSLYIRAVQRGGFSGRAPANGVNRANR